jgi:hypothetical protein
MLFGSNSVRREWKQIWYLWPPIEKQIQERSGWEPSELTTAPFSKWTSRCDFPLPVLTLSVMSTESNGISLLDSSAFSQASTAISSILGGESRFDRRQTRRCVHTKPVVAAVGWSQQDAETQGIEYLAVSDTIHLVSDNERSVVQAEPTFKGIIDPRIWHLFGCLVVGDHAAVIANSASIASGSGSSVKSGRHSLDATQRDGSSSGHLAEALTSAPSHKWEACHLG